MKQTNAMVKILCAVLMFITMTFSFTACGKAYAGPAASNPQTPAASKKTPSSATTARDEMERRELLALIKMQFRFQIGEAIYILQQHDVPVEIEKQIRTEIAACARLAQDIGSPMHTEVHIGLIIRMLEQLQERVKKQVAKYPLKSKPAQPNGNVH